MPSTNDLKGPLAQADRLVQGLTEVNDRIKELQAASAGRTPTQEVAKRAAEGGTGIATAAYAVGLQNHKNMLAQHASRQVTSFKAMVLAAMGGNQQDRNKLIEQALAEDGGNMGGDVLVTGDINIDNHLPDSAKPTPTPAPQIQPQAPAQKSGVLPWLAGAAATGVVGTALGVGGSYLLNKPTPTPPVPAAVNTNTTSGFNIRLLEKPPEGAKP
jgi:hypothetical protein